MKDQIYEGIAALEKRTGKTFGKGPKPLLVSVRSGARVSMPGMMDTILNLGLNDTTVEALAKQSNKPRFAYDCYRRFILMFTNIAKGHPRTKMDAMLDEIKKRLNLENDYEVPVEELKVLVKKYKDYYKETFNEEFPSDPKVQLLIAVEAIFKSWDNERANIYRKLNNIPYSWGTAVNVQMMAFGNMNSSSGTGVGFTRRPTDGVNEIFTFFTLIFKKWIVGNEVICGVLTSQIISNVPAAMLLSGFSTNYEAIIVGINIGGFGTLIASMANLISFKILAREFDEFKARYLVVFTVFNVILLVILLGVNFLM